MSGRRIEIASELMAQGRQLYENTLMPTRDIALKMGISRTTLDGRISEWKWQRRNYQTGEHAAAAPATTMAAATPLPAAPAGALLPADFASHLFRIIGAHLNAVERTIQVLNPHNDAEAERTTRTRAERDWRVLLGGAAEPVPQFRRRRRAGR
jgi:hypothetical protein